MIDMNCRILHGVGDGTKHTEESVAMAKEAADQGIHKIIAAPYYIDGEQTDVKKKTIEHVDQLNERLKAENIPLSILPGQVTRVHGEVMERVEQGDILSINETSDYLLMELPSTHLLQYTNQLIFDLQIRGYRPVLVHPERNQLFMEDPNQLYDLVKKGALVQLATSSILGKYGKRVRKFSRQLIETNLAHFIASESHSAKGLNLTKAYKVIKKIYGEDRFAFFMENARLLASGEPVVGGLPTRIKKKKFLGLL